MIKLIRTSTIPVSLNVLLKGQLKFLRNHFEIIAISGAGDNLEEVKKREKVKVFPIQMMRNISPVKDFVSLVKLYFYFRKEKPHIVHSITPKAGLLSMAAAKMANVPVRMHTFTGLIFPTRTGTVQKILILMDRVLCMCATDIYPEGNGVRQDLIKFKITDKPLKVLANGNVNGVDLDYFCSEAIDGRTKERTRIENEISPEDFIFIFVGRLVGDKGINELVSAFTKFKVRNLKLLLVGSLETELDPLSPETLKEIEENPHIISVGFQQDVRPFFAISHALVFPSYREGFPNVVMQAGAMELPAIVSDINGCNEIIVQNENGLIIPVKDTDSLEKAMARLLNDNTLYLKLKSNARRMIQERYEQQIVWGALLEEYYKLIKEKKLK